jgi:hypothetical protein
MEARGDCGRRQWPEAEEMQRQRRLGRKRVGGRGAYLGEGWTRWAPEHTGSGVFFSEPRVPSYWRNILLESLGSI